jgi:hypothetical protein
MKQSLKFAFAAATIVASGAVFAQNTPQKSPAKTQVAQTKPGAQALGSSAPAAPAAAAPLGLPAAVAASLTALGAASTNDNNTPPKH